MKKEYLVSANEMKQLDDNTIKKTGIPSLVLMERAALAVARCTMAYLKEMVSGKILIVAGNGNNAADGVCAGRILKEYGYDVDICLLKSRHDYTGELQLQNQIARTYNIPFLSEEEVDFKHYRVVIDSIFGIGLNRDVDGPAKDMILRINESDCYVISVDIPSGINASTGEVCATAVRADETVTFGFYKCGQMLYPGREYGGKITKAYIGINETSFYDMVPEMFIYMAEDNEQLPLKRSVTGNKGTFGKVLVIAGRASTAGAALLSAKSALRSGCGMVAVMTESDNKEVFLANLPEAMVEIYSSGETQADLKEKLDKWLAWADVVVIGCGLGKDDIAYRLLERSIAGFDGPIVADADALSLFALHTELKEELYNRSTNENKGQVIFTPHPGELATLAHCSISDVKRERFFVTQKVCEEYGVTLVAKDADTLCISKGDQTYLNVSGNEGMSTAGSVDVLAGLIASLVAQGIKAGIQVYDAVCLAVYLHGLAGDYQAKRNGKHFLVASDIIEAYKYILK